MPLNFCEIVMHLFQDSLTDPKILNKGVYERCCNTVVNSSHSPLFFSLSAGFICMG